MANDDKQKPAVPEWPAKPDGLPDVPVPPRELTSGDDPPVEIPPPAPAEDAPAKEIPTEVPRKGQGVRDAYEASVAQRRKAALDRLSGSSLLSPPD